MAEVFGIVSGAVGIAGAFRAVVACFEYVKLSRRFGRDFQTSQLSLNHARLRLSRWGEAVQVYDDPRLGNPKATPEELQLAKDTLLQVLQLFEDSSIISRKYKLNANSEEISESFEDELDPMPAALNNIMKRLALRRQKGGSILKATKWAIFDKSEFQQLIENIMHLTDKLETLFPAPLQEASLINEEIREIHDAKQLKLLADTARHVDDRLQQAAGQALIGNQFLSVQVNTGARAVNGDAFVSGWQGGAVGRSHTYDGVVISGDRTKAVNGNQYGGKSIWDD
jgi:hypothetical protein